MKIPRLLRVAAILVIMLATIPLAAQDGQPTDEQRRKADELRDDVVAD